MYAVIAAVPPVEEIPEEDVLIPVEAHKYASLEEIQQRVQTVHEAAMEMRGDHVLLVLTASTFEGLRHPARMAYEAAVGPGYFVEVHCHG